MPKNLTIAESPAQDRPRERLIKLGAEHLRLAELFAVLIRSGRKGESAVQAGERLAAVFGDQLERLPDSSGSELKEISQACGPTAYCQIMAGIELGRRVAEAKGGANNVRRITGSRDAIDFCSSHFARLVSDGHREEFHIVCLDTKNQVIVTHMISIGTLDASLVHPREVFRPAIKDAAASVILVHNHPSGDPTPSREDHVVTKRLEEAGKTLGIDVLDHIVLGGRGGVSIRDNRS
jgi:DNA repair protein RadC